MRCICDGWVVMAASMREHLSPHLEIAFLLLGAEKLDRIGLTIQNQGHPMKHSRESIQEAAGFDHCFSSSRSVPSFIPLSKQPCQDCAPHPSRSFLSIQSISCVTHQHSLSWKHSYQRCTAIASSLPVVSNLYCCSLISLQQAFCCCPLISVCIWLFEGDVLSVCSNDSFLLQLLTVRSTDSF